MLTLQGQTSRDMRHWNCAERRTALCSDNVDILQRMVLHNA